MLMLLSVTASSYNIDIIIAPYYKSSHVHLWLQLCSHVQLSLMFFAYYCTLLLLLFNSYHNSEFLFFFKK